MAGTEERAARLFDDAVARLRAANVPGESGRLRALFDYLADRGAGAAPASQADIADEVFGQTEAVADDATVRVYIHRLRKRLDEHYASQDADALRLTIPAGAYVLRLVGPAVESVAAPRWPLRAIGLAALAALLLGTAFVAGRWLSPGDVPVNAIWKPLVDSPRPKLIVVGDYYMFGEIDHVTPDKSRLIRDFRVGSPGDLIALQQEEPERYGNAEDVGLSYLPVSAAFAIEDIAPILATRGQAVRVIAASELQPDMLNYSDVVYVGLFSGMALLEEVNFMNSGFGIGESYDELVDTATGKAFVSEEAHNLPSAVYYNDYGYVSRLRSPGGAWVVVVAGARDTGLRGIAPLVAGDNLPNQVERTAERGNFEAVFQITGQKGADISEKLLQIRPRP